jgi:hypothetical protein
MSCEEIRSLLEAFVDGEIPSSGREAVTRHLDSCASCREEARALFALASEARETLGPLAPARDLWPGIAGHIDSARRFERRRRIHSAWWLAAAALIGIAVGAALMRPRPEPTDALATVEQSKTSLDVALVGWEQEVRQHRSTLLASLELQRDRLPAESIRAVEENLLLIDEAIGEIRSALERDPDNRKLNFLLADAYQQEVQLLKRLGHV